MNTASKIEPLPNRIGLAAGEAFAHRPFADGFARIVAARRACAPTLSSASSGMTYEQAAQDYRRLVYQHAHRYRRSASLDDLAQEGFEALFAAVDKWPHSLTRARGFSFFMFAASRIHGRLSRVAQYARRNGFTGNHGVELGAAVSFDCDDEHGITLHDVMGTAPVDEEALAEAEQLEIMNVQIARLSERNRAIVGMVREGVDHDVVGERWGVTRGTVGNVVAAFVQQVRAMLSKSRRPNPKRIAVTPFKRLKTREKGPCKEIVYKGRSQRITAWAEEVGLPQMLVRKRLHAGWTVERALETPSLGGNDARRANARASGTGLS